MEEALIDGGVVGAANWWEVAQKLLQHGWDWDAARALLLSYPLAVEPVMVEDAERAATLWRPGPGLSLADRLCLALGGRLKATVWTADAEWGAAGHIHQVRQGGDQTGFRDLRSEFNAGLTAVNLRMDRLFLTMVGGLLTSFAAMAGILVTVA